MERPLPILRSAWGWIAATCLICNGAFAQDWSGEPRRLPTVYSPGPAGIAEPYPATPQPIVATGYDLPLATPLIDQESPLSTQPAIDAPRDGFFQKINFDADYLPGSPISNFGMVDLALSSTYALPFPAHDKPLVLTPGVEAHYLDGPSAADVPARLYDFWLKVRTLGKIDDRWGYDVAVIPGWHSDLDNNAGNAFRITGYGFAAYTWNDEVQILLGVMYLNQTNLRLLPAAGLIWTPNPDTRVELTAPRPRLAHRIVADACSEQWVYIAGEYGGGTWAIEQAGGVHDLMTYSDYRILLGWERKTAGGINTVVEFGYAFGREISFAYSTSPAFDPTDTMLVRVGAKY